MPRNQTEKSRPITRPGWIIARAQGPSTHYDTQELAIIVRWNQSFANRCDKLWRMLDTLKQTEPDLKYLAVSNLDMIAHDVDGELAAWMNGYIDESKEHERWDAFADGELFSTTEPPDGSRLRGSLYSSSMLVFGSHIGWGGYVVDSGIFETDGFIYRKDPELFKVDP